MKLKFASHAIVCLVAGMLLSLAVSAILTRDNISDDTVAGMLSVLIEIIYAVLIYGLVGKTIRAKIGGSYGVIGAIVCAVIMALILGWLSFCSHGSFILIFILALAYAGLLYGYAAKFDKK